MAAKKKTAKKKPPKRKKLVPREQPEEGATSDRACNAALEAAILEDRDNPAPYLVYADWLESEGDPRGELISIQVALDEAKGAKRKKLQKREQEILTENDFLSGVSPDHATVTWRWGFFDSVRFDNQDDWMDDDFDIQPTVDRIFSHPASALVRTLRVGVIRWMKNNEDVPAILEAIAGYDRSKPVERVILGDVLGDIDLAHHTLGELDLLSEHYPNLSVLDLFGSDFLFSHLDLPHLEKLSIQTCGLPRDCLRAIAQTPYPELRRLELWFGSTDYGADCKLADVRPILTGARLPALEELCLMNGEFADELAAEIGGAEILPQLRLLDLSRGTMADEGAEHLLAAADALAHLESLSIDDNYLSPEVVRRLKRALGKRLFSEQQRELDPQDPSWRFVSAWE